MTALYWALLLYCPEFLEQLARENSDEPIVVDTAK